MDSLRRSKTVGSDTYKYYYNGDYVVNETRNGSNFATNVYGVDGPISRQYSGMEHYYFKNAHGDVIYAFTSGKWRSSEYSYSAYGEEGVSYDYYSANPNPIRYSGEYFDTESGMTYLRARYYDPFQRRFISEDPIRDGANWYAYCENNPVMFVDPSGLEENKVSQFIADYGATRLYDNEEEQYTMVELNGIQQKIYWNPINNTNAYAIDSDNIEGYLRMERQDFLCLFGIDYEVVQSKTEYNGFVSWLINEAIGFISGGYLDGGLEKGEYITERFYTVLGDKIYYTHSLSKRDGVGERMSLEACSTWPSPDDAEHLKPTVEEWYIGFINSGYIDVKR